MSNSEHVRELLELAHDKSIEARLRLVNMIGDIFSEREQVLTERERVLMTEILEKLINDFEMTLRHELAKRLADKPAVPQALVTMLANDEIEVARPILMQSKVLQDQELIRIIRNRTRQHQLAIAMRREVSEPVADALVDTGDEDVITTLLQNDSARISEATMAYLVEQSRTLDTFQEPLVARRDLDPKLARKLYLTVSVTLRHRILEQYEIEVNALDDLLETVWQDLAQAEQERGPDAAWVLAESISAEREIDAPLIIKVLRRGEIALFEALFGEVSGIRPPRLQHVLYETGGKGLAIACKALDIEKANFAPIFLLSRKGRGGEQVVDPREVSGVLQFFDNIARDAAHEVLRAWQRDDEYLSAIESIEEDLRVRAKSAG